MISLFEKVQNLLVCMSSYKAEREFYEVVKEASMESISTVSDIVKELSRKRYPVETLSVEYNPNIIVTNTAIGHLLCDILEHSHNKEFALRTNLTHEVLDNNLSRVYVRMAFVDKQEGNHQL